MNLKNTILLIIYIIIIIEYRSLIFVEYGSSITLIFSQFIKYKTYLYGYNNSVKLPTGQQISKYQFFYLKNQIFINGNLIFHIQTLSRDRKINLYPSIETSLCTTIQSRQYNISKKDEDQLFTNKKTNVNQIKFNPDTYDYNLNELIVYFNNEAEDEIVLQLEFSCEAIKVPIFGSSYPYFVENYHDNSNLEQMLRLWNACEQCDSTQGVVSLTLNAQKCDIKNDISSIAVYKNQIQLRCGYWRSHFDTKLISYCINLLKKL